MKPIYVLSENENSELKNFLSSIEINPYKDYVNFHRNIEKLYLEDKVPHFFRKVCEQIREERKNKISNIHTIRNCPIDDNLPDLDPEDPVNDKFTKKNTFVGEALLETFSVITKTPLLAYGSRNKGSFFTDVIAIKKYSGKLTGYSDSELVYHNDRTAHEVRADYVSLLGMISPEDELIYTGYMDGIDILKNLTDSEQEILRKPWFKTKFDIFSQESNKNQIESFDHPIIENESSIRYIETLTNVSPDAPQIAKDAFIAFMQSLPKTTKFRHRILTGDLFCFANQDGLHSRERIDISDAEKAATRWLLKTYAFRNDETADKFSSYWKNNFRGLVDD
ncbi:taurine catabolism dioxygenase TauD [Vibrio spartinae]|uniref:Taurine catabolism dioxygenase TauD, TfdA family n=1 Tax=Vibrio spartinae TaxID=1918945 RepID=A0A1N6MC00_9VIBR|nr:taurine catabolism dioxygenase TauD [Vibrio spartinae]SIO96887.1 Taurine catabolism dioxygenase TauD, TfdA family [Vibrio spartinae]